MERLIHCTNFVWIYQPSSNYLPIVLQFHVLCQLCTIMIFSYTFCIIFSILQNKLQWLFYFHCSFFIIKESLSEILIILSWPILLSKRFSKSLNTRKFTVKEIIAVKQMQNYKKRGKYDCVHHDDESVFKMLLLLTLDFQSS